MKTPPSEAGFFLENESADEILKIFFSSDFPVTTKNR